MTPLSTLDDAVRLLRRAPAATLLCHPIGSVPFALSLLAAWNTVTDPHTTAVSWAVHASIPTLLFVWMNCWRAVYASKLRLELSDAPWIPTRLATLIAAQCAVGAAKLLFLPLAALVIFPFAEAVAFHRYLPILSTQTGLSLKEMIARARRLAAFDRGQVWAILPILLFLQLALALNFAAVLAVLPQLVRMLTGYESAFSRSGIHFLENPLFPLLVLALTWVFFDPFVQAVYAVRYFHAESRETGEDLRSGLRRLRAPAPAMLALAALSLTPLRAAVSASELQQSIQQAAQAPEYDWRLPPARTAVYSSWFVRLTDSLVSAGRSIGRAIGNALGRFFRWLFDRLQNALPSGAPGAAAGGVHWVVYLLIAIALAAALLIIWRQRRAPRADPAGPGAGPIRLDAVDLTPDLLPEESWLTLAERSFAEQNFRFGLRALYLATLAWLGRRQFLTIHLGKTNHAYEMELARRSRPIPEARRLFAANVAAFERAWYGEHAVGEGDVAEFRERMQALKDLLESPMGAVA